MATQNTDDEKVELPKEITDAIAVLKKGSKEHAAAIAEELSGSPVYQAVFNDGHSEATKRAGTKQADLAKKLKDAEARNAELETERDELKKATPDLAKRDQDWQKKLDKKDEEIAAERTQRERIIGDVTTERLRSALKDKLRPKYAELVAPTLASRIRRKADGTEELLEEGSEIPVSIPKGKTVYQVAADLAYEAADAVDRLAGGESGGGRTGGGGGATGPSHDELMKRKLSSGMYGSGM
jgi:hypothetical protein